MYSVFGGEILSIFVEACFRKGFNFFFALQELTLNMRNKNVTKCQKQTAGAPI